MKLSPPKATLLELAAVALGLAVVGFFYLTPASAALLRGDASVMIGDNTDSITNPWQYAVVLDTLKHAPARLLFGAIYTDQLGAPEGEALYIPFVERFLVLGLAPFLRTDLLPTAIVWALLTMSGVALYACGRLLGWHRALAFGLAMAFALTPYTRARGTVHIVLAGVYWAPAALAAILVLARPPEWLARGRRPHALSAALLLSAAFAAHYYVIIGAVLAPFFLWLYVYLLPRGASLVQALGRLAVAAAPAILFIGWTAVLPVPPGAHPHVANVAISQKETDNYLHWYGAHPIDFVTSDVKFGDRDLFAARSKLNTEVRAEVHDNLHERTNGIRWSVIALFGAAVLALGHRRLRRLYTDGERRIAVAALALGVVAFSLAISPQGIKVYDTELGPVQVVGRFVPRYRVPSRMGPVVNLAAILGAGTLLTALTRRSRRARAMLAVSPLVVLIDYLPREPVPMQPIAPARVDLAQGGACGAGMTLPYATWETPRCDYYKVMADLRGTDCKLVHTGYLTEEDARLRALLGKPEDVEAHVEEAKSFARCTGSSFVIFRQDLAEGTRAAFCDAMGWTRVAPDACRAPGPPPPPRSAASCVP